MEELNAGDAKPQGDELIFEIESSQSFRNSLLGFVGIILGLIGFLPDSQSGISGFVLDSFSFIFIVGGIIFLIAVLLKYPRLSFRDGVLLSRRFPGWTKTFNLVELGAAHVVTQKARYARFTYLAFFTRAEEQSMALLASAHRPSPFNTARHIELTTLIGNDLELAQKIAETINRHRPAARPEALTTEQATRQLKTVRTRSRRYWLWMVLVVIAAAALEFLWD